MIQFCALLCEFSLCWHIPLKGMVCSSIMVLALVTFLLKLKHCSLHIFCVAPSLSLACVSLENPRYQSKQHPILLVISFCDKKVYIFVSSWILLVYITFSMIPLSILHEVYIPLWEWSQRSHIQVFGHILTSWNLPLHFCPCQDCAYYQRL